MKSFKLKKIVAAAVAAMTIATISPVGASAKWKQNETGWWNTEGSSYSTGWIDINNSWYYFGQDGYMHTGWANVDGTWYFTNASGAMQTGEVIIDGVKYTFAASGEAVGEAPKVTNAFNSNGTPVKGETNKPADKDSNKEEERTHGGGGGGGSHHSKPTVQQDIDKDYKEAKIITENKIADDKYEFTFAKGFDQKGYDYVTRDLYITNNDGTATGISYENDKYTFKPGKYTVKSVIRVVRDGKIYYVTPDVKTIEVK
ncbi:hypothetical protein [Clostridium botulinum]|uniref:hypothetical protein n=1 Tax=Clostridium botulinum TaxID=1491 RepID=UPI000774DBC2|nr:hypothetical protein [Clostridium botulinum]HBJ2623318.1 hypothetical protein [Clostridium botulinum]